jgi:hypothetical protein
MAKQGGPRKVVVEEQKGSRRCAVAARRGVGARSVVVDATARPAFVLALCGGGTSWHFSKNCRHAWWVSRRAPHRTCAYRRKIEAPLNWRGLLLRLLEGPFL